MVGEGMGRHWSAEDQNSPTEALRVQVLGKAGACLAALGPRDNLFEEIRELGENLTL